MAIIIRNGKVVGGGGEASTFTNNNPSTITVGGIEAGTTFDAVSFAEFAQMLLYPYVPATITNFTSSDSAGTYEYGTTKAVNSLTVSFTNGSNPIRKIMFFIGDSWIHEFKGIPASPYTGEVDTRNWDGMSEVTFTCNLYEDPESTEVKATKSIKFTPTFSTYYAVSNSNTTIPTSGTKGNDTNITVGDNQYIWFFSKDAKSHIQQYANGQWNNIDTFDKGTVEFTLSSGVTYTYHAYVGPELMASTEKYKIV